MESLKRFYSPEEIHDPQMILIVGALGLLVNLVGLLLFAEHGHSHGGHGHSHGKPSKYITYGKTGFSPTSTKAEPARSASLARRI